MKKKIRLLIIIPELRHGGTEKFILNFINNIDDKYSIILCCVGTTNLNFKNYFSSKNIKLIILNSSIKFCLFKLIREIKNNKPDIVFSNLWALNILSNM